MTTITLAEEPTGTPAPYVDIIVDDFPVGVSTVTVWRTAKNRAFRVRGLVNVSTAGVVTIRDFEAPWGVELSYRAEQFDSSGNFVSWSDAETITLTAPDVDVAWLHNPFDPSTSVRVDVTIGAARDVVRPNNAELFRPKGRSAPIVISDTRSGVTGVLLTVTTVTLNDADKIDDLFGGYDDGTVPIIVIRTHPLFRLPQPFFAYCDQPRMLAAATRAGGEFVDFELTADEVAPPVEASVTALLDYADFTAAYADYAAFTAAYADYAEATRDYSIAGTA